MKIQQIQSDIKQCSICREKLPLSPNPVVQLSEQAKLLIIGQAPGIRVHNSHIPWNDPSGDRLRQWLQLPRETFYNPEQIAIMPMGFCYPGTGPSGDLPPRPECAPQWHQLVLDAMPHIQLTLLIGQYAQQYYLGQQRQHNLTETVKAYQQYLPQYCPLPHPSPRNNRWLKKNPWFESTLIPDLQSYIDTTLS